MAEALGAQTAGRQKFWAKRVTNWGAMLQFPGGLRFLWQCVFETSAPYELGKDPLGHWTQAHQQNGTPTSGMNCVTDAIMSEESFF